MADENLKQLLSQALLNNQCQVSPLIQDKLVAYLELLQNWNRVYNLTAIRDPQAMVLLHILDSLAINPYLQGNRLIDVGTGAGLPGVPLALLNATKHFVLLDSNNKKTRFLIQVCAELNLKNIEVIHARCEDYHPLDCFDSIISRAFSSLKNMLLATQHFAGINSQFLAMKGTYPKEEIATIPENFMLLKVHDLKISGLDQHRCLVCLGPK